MRAIQLLLLAFAPLVCTIAQVNKPPVVTIERPVTGTRIAAGVPVPYAIRVIDAEDGDSRFDEISTAEVVLLVVPLKDTAGSLTSRRKAEEMLPGLFRMREANCLTCHAAQATLIGPSLAKIAGRYSTAEVPSLARKVRSGGAGVWGDVAMPSHPDLSEDEARTLVNWIISAFTADVPVIQTGSSGVFRVPADRNAAGCLLVAGYRDHGVMDQGGAKTGSATISVLIR